MTIEALFAEQHDVFLRRLERMVGDPDTAADLAQEAFVRAWRAIPRDVPVERQRGWLHRTASNLAVDELRRRRRRPAAPLDDALAAGPHADPAERAAAREALQALRPHERLVLLLRVEGRLSYAEIGALLDVAEDAARKRVVRARRAFAAAYEARRADRGPLVLLIAGPGEAPGPYRRWLVQPAGGSARYPADDRA